MRDEELADGAVLAPGAVAQVPEIVAAAGARKVLLVCGRTSFDASGAARMLGPLGEVAEVVRFDDFVPNTDAADLARGIALLAADPPDLVLGVGGGSAMDMAKLLCAFEDADPDDLPNAISSAGVVERRRPGLLLVPTTAGSGSEATHFAVVYVGDDKHSVAGPAMLPDRVVLDPDLLTSGPAPLRASSGIDALCQAVESLWATGASEQSRGFARAALDRVLPAIEGFVADADAATAAQMSIGAHLAGRAINVSKTTAPHALSYAITKRHGVPHGHAVALTLGPVLAAHAQADPADLQPGHDADAHRQVMDEMLARFGAADGEAAHRAFVELVDRVGLAPRLSQLGEVDDEELGVLAAAVNVERLANNPVRFDGDGLRAILDRAR